jgi:hypothetical protein
LLYADFVSLYFAQFFVVSNHFVVESLGLYHLGSSVQRNDFSSSLSILMAFISFYCLIALTKASGIMLIGRSQSGHPELFWSFIIEYGVPCGIFVVLVVLFVWRQSLTI